MRGATCTRCHLYALRLVLAAPSFFKEVLRVLPLVLAARSARHADLYPQHIASLVDEHFRSRVGSEGVRVTLPYRV